MNDIRAWQDECLELADQRWHRRHVETRLSDAELSVHGAAGCLWRLLRCGVRIQVLRHGRDGQDVTLAGDAAMTANNRRDVEYLQAAWSEMSSGDRLRVVEQVDVWLVGRRPS